MQQFIHCPDDIKKSALMINRMLPQQQQKTLSSDRRFLVPLFWPSNFPPWGFYLATLDGSSPWRSSSPVRVATSRRRSGVRSPGMEDPDLEGNPDLEGMEVSALGGSHSWLPWLWLFFISVWKRKDLIIKSWSNDDEIGISFNVSIRMFVNKLRSEYLCMNCICVFIFIYYWIVWNFTNSNCIILFDSLLERMQLYVFARTHYLLIYVKASWNLFSTDFAL